ncbi:hypothetical protein N431DRAFT_241953 [Stipitochalara longipes BDJ]|nr:hypothetical protein N431DRAFT_241953 [Stipitochalara longipes BDJ]
MLSIHGVNRLTFEARTTAITCRLQNDQVQNKQTDRPFESRMLEVAESNMLECPAHLGISTEHRFCYNAKTTWKQIDGAGSLDVRAQSSPIAKCRRLIWKCDLELRYAVTIASRAHMSWHSKRMQSTTSTAVSNLRNMPGARSSEVSSPMQWKQIRLL